MGNRSRSRLSAVRSVAIVPTYNEADNIEALCRSIRLHAPGVGILVVDDNSPDGTAKIAEGLADELGDITVLHRPGKSGLGAAYRAGMRAAIDAGAEICIQIDADLSHCLLYTSPSPRDRQKSRMPSSA